MSKKQEYSDIGEILAGALKDAMESREFKELNHVVSDTVNVAMDEMRRQVNHISQAVHEQNSSRNGQEKAGEGKAADSGERARSFTEQYRYTYKQPGSRTMYASNRRKAGSEPTETGISIDRSSKTGGVLWLVFGSIGTGAFALTGLANLLVWAFKQTVAAAVPVVVMASLAILCGSFIGKGCTILNRLKRAEGYARLGSRMKFLELEEIARNTGRNIRKVRADVKKMLQLGIFPEGHMDQHESCLILDDETWQQYKITQREWENRKVLEDRQASEAEREQQEQEPAGEQLGQQEKIIRDGHAYMERLRDLNTAIPGEVISNKLFQLDYVLNRIFSVLREHPEKSPQMRKFMEYYLPTTVKLVESYAEFDKAGVEGENIRSAKEEIEKTMDTINRAFEKLLDDIFLNEAMETAADAQVLKTLLAQDGYADNDFEKY